MAVVCSGNCLAQGQITRPTKQTTTPANTVTPPKQQVKSKSNRKTESAQTKVKASNPDGYYNNHGYVDLGLPSGTKWATCNIGSSAPEKIGTFFAWGETNSKPYYSSTNSLNFLDKYRPTDLSKNSNLISKYDAAHVNWGTPWRMPTSSEMQELINECTWQWIKSPMGMLVTGPNGKSIFLPASESKVKGITPLRHDIGFLWLSTHDGRYNPSQLNFREQTVYVEKAPAYQGNNIRPVCQ